MTEPSQYFKGRTVQEQMNEVIGYVDARAEEVAAAKADDVLEPAEQAKDDAIAAKEAAENARDTTLAALPQIQQDITDLKAEDVALDGRLDNVELRITTAEGNIVTIQGRVTAVETKNSQQDSAIAALQTADEQNIKLTGPHAIGNYSVLLTGNQSKSGNMTFYDLVRLENESQYLTQLILINKQIDKTNRTERQETSIFFQGKNNENLASLIYAKYPNGEKHLIARLFDDSGSYHDTDLASWSGDI